MSNIYDYRHQPKKGLFLAYQLITTPFVRLPIWTISSLFPSWRPRRSWSLKKTLLIKNLRHLTYIGSRAGALRILPDHRALASNVTHAVWIPPVPDSLISPTLRQWASVADVTPVKLPGYWLTSPSHSALNPTEDPAGEDEKVLLCLHGGAYIELSAYPEDETATISKGLLEALEDKGIRRAFSIEYRLSKGDPYDPAHPFPTALLDALSGYYYLVHERGFKPENIIIEGDSAGGNLTLALTRYLCDTVGSIPELPGPPGAIILLSPWTDLSGSHDVPGSSVRTLHESDYLAYPMPESEMRPNVDPQRFIYPIRAFTGPHGLGAASFNEYISPASKRLHAPQSLFRFGSKSSEDGGSSNNTVLWPPTFIAAGGAELFLDQIRTLKERMVASGVDIEYLEAPDGTHDWVAFKWFEPERSETLAAIAAWVGKRQH